MLEPLRHPSTSARHAFGPQVPPSTSSMREEASAGNRAFSPQLWGPLGPQGGHFQSRRSRGPHGSADELARKAGTSPAGKSSSGHSRRIPSVLTERDLG